MATTAADAATLAEADALVSEGKIQEAVTKYHAVLTTNPKNDEAQTQLGIDAKAWTYLGMVRYDLARRRDATDYRAVEDALNKGIPEKRRLPGVAGRL